MFLLNCLQHLCWAVTNAFSLFLPSTSSPNPWDAEQVFGWKSSSGWLPQDAGQKPALEQKGSGTLGKPYINENHSTLFIQQTFIKGHDVLGTVLGPENWGMR